MALSLYCSFKSFFSLKTSIQNHAKNNILSRPCPKFNWAALLLCTLITGNFANLIAQPINCGVEVSPGLAQAMMETTQDVEDYTAARSMESPATGIVPVRFIYVNGSTSNTVNQSNNDFAINKLNQAFASANLQFVQCGNSNELWDDRFQNMDGIDLDLTLFAYSSNTLEVYVKHGAGTAWAVIPCNVYDENNPNYNLQCYTHENFMRLLGTGDFGSTIVHEAGHHFGLLHTWFPAPTGLSLGRNYMSYWHRFCLNEFTPKQIDRVTYYYDTEKAPLYKPDRCGTFTDRVEYRGTNIGLHNVTVRMRHSDDAAKCNITTSQSGDYSGLLATDIG